MWDPPNSQKIPARRSSTARKRRRHVKSDWVEDLKVNWAVKFLVFSLFLAGLGTLVTFLPTASSYKLMVESTGLGVPVILALLVLSALHLRSSVRELWDRNARVLLFYLLLLLHLALIKLSVFTLEKAGKSEDWVLLCAPYALAPVLLTLLVGPQVGFIAVFYATLFGVLLVGQKYCLVFAFMSLGLGVVGIVATRNLRKRSELMRAGLYLALAGVLMGAAFGLLGNFWNGLALLDWPTVGRRAVVVVAGGLATVTVVSGLLPVLEALFRITTTISWIELADVNHPLLRRLSLEAPGTYFHSQMVASLAENAAEAIGANGTICRVCSYFHDIGKLEHPEFCIENMSGEQNPHDLLAPQKSAEIIISHVPDGVELASKFKLNREIIDAILQHHGTSLVYFFYRRAKDHWEAVQAGTEPRDAEAVEPVDADFRYPGPKPQTAENAIISLADTIESASRSWGPKLNTHRLEDLVADIVDSRLRDGQLEECNLTLAELRAIKESFVLSLRTMNHKRIAYPEEKKEPKSEGSAEEQLVSTN
jgi:cyclic-di-AMP phosphodiesterase PgpH